MPSSISLAWLVGALATAAGPGAAAGTGPGGPAAPLPDQPPLAAEPLDDGRPSHGAPQDLALWATMRDEQNQMSVERALARKLYFRLRAEDEDAQLAALAKARPELSARIDPLRQRLYAARKTSFDLMSSKWLVDPRLGCRPEMYDLGGAMEALPGQPGGSDLAPAREGALRCQVRLRLVLDPLRKTTRELQAVVADVERFLAANRATPVAPTPGPASLDAVAPGTANPGSVQEGLQGQAKP